MTTEGVAAGAVDRLSFTIFVALTLHAIIVLGVTFGLEDPKPAPHTMEITLAQFDDVEQPENADFLAQANQQGSGTVEEVSKISTPIKAEQKATEIKKVEKITAKTEKDEGKFLRKEKRARKKIDDALLAVYDRLATTYKNGLAVVIVERDACGGCFSQVPPQTQLELGQRKRIINCEHCARVLVASNIQTSLEELELELIDAGLEEIEEEFDDHRRTALEREQKVRRQLQDEINKQKGL